jgi:hypothetical protein
MKSLWIKVSIILLSVCFLSFSKIQAGERIMLVKNGVAKSTIVISTNPTQVSQFAADELQYWIKKITGVKLPIVYDNAKIQGNKILIGESKYTKIFGLSNNKFQNQQYSIKFYPHTIILIGKDSQKRCNVIYPTTLTQWQKNPDAYNTWPGNFQKQGSLYATYDFLTKFCGIKWINPTIYGTVCPEQKSLIIDGKNLTRKPFFIYRAYPNYYNLNQNICLWPAGTKGFKKYEKTAYGKMLPYQTSLIRLFFLRMKDGGEMYNVNHSLYGYYDRFWEKSKDPNLAKFFVQKRPEYFARGYQGKPPQLNYSSKALIKQVIKDGRNYFDGKKTGAQLDIFWQPVLPNPFPVVPMDDTNFSKDKESQKWIAKGKDRNADSKDSDYIFHFVNKVAKGLLKTNPDQKVGALAYASYMGVPDFKLEPNIVVEFCFWNNRMPYNKGYQRNLKLLKEWYKKSQRDKFLLGLWLYPTFPQETADDYGFYCFPGFFANTIDKQFKLFEKYHIFGMFQCGYGQDVEVYVTFRLMDNPNLNINKLLNDYFTGLYGSAAEPMKKLYLYIEKIYTNPVNYPSNAGMQTAQIAWGDLGTKSRMEKMDKFLKEAERMAKTKKDKTNILLFKESIWSYMKAGFAQYQEILKSSIPVIYGVKIKNINGDLSKVDWKKGYKIKDFYEGGSDKKSLQNLEAMVLYDNNYLYLELIDSCNTSKLSSSAVIFPYDDWELWIAKHRGDLAYRHIAINPRGQIVVLSKEINSKSDINIQNSGIKKISEIEKNKWITKIAIPFKKMFTGGVKKGHNIYLNITRIESPAISDKNGIDILTFPSFTDLHQTNRLAELKLNL